MAFERCAIALYPRPSTRLNATFSERARFLAESGDGKSMDNNVGDLLLGPLIGEWWVSREGWCDEVEAVEGGGRGI